MPDRRIPIFLVLLLTIWIACSLSSSSARRVVDGATTSNAFDLFDYGAVFENSDIETDYFAENPPRTDDISQEAFHEAMQAATDTFDVLDFGAVGNGQADDTNAFLKAWSAVCGAAQGRGGIPTVVVPKGKQFLLNPLRFEGPCKARKVNFQIQGTIVAPKYFALWTDKDEWIQFSNVPGLIINGGGLMDGNGDSWWRHCDKNANCGTRPTALHIHKCDGLKMSRLTLVNSPRSHVSISGSSVVHIHSIAIWAPKESPNTDGIDISGSTSVNIQTSHIGTGDDCIAINSGSSFINITDVQCGPGHGISIGSLGKHGQYSTVEEVQVRNCSFVGTQNGVRIKTWEAGSGYARKILFEGIKFTDVENPIIIDQHYFDYPMTYGGKEESKCVQVSDVIYRNVVGSTVDEKAINFDCAASGCTNILLDNVSITPANPSKMTYAYCNNAHGTAISSIPYVPCLAH